MAQPLREARSKSSFRIWPLWLFVPLALIWFIGFGLPLARMALSFGNMSAIADNGAVLRKSLLFATLLTFLSLAVGAVLAFACRRLHSTAQRMLVALSAALVVLNPLIIAASVYILLQRTGPVAFLLGVLGIEPRLLYTPLGPVIGAAYLFVPLVLLGLLAARSEVPQELVETAEGLGAGRLVSIRSVVFPLMMPNVIVIGFIVFVGGFGLGIVPDILGGPSDRLIAHRLQKLALDMGDIETANALSLLAIMISSLAAAGIAVMLRRREMNLAAGIEKSQMADTRCVTRGTGARMTGIVLAGIVGAPLMCLLVASMGSGRLILFPPRDMSFSWYLALVTSAEWRNALALSLLLSGSVAFLATGVSLIAALATSMLNWPWRLVVDTMSVLPGIAPPMAIAVASASVKHFLHLNPYLHLAIVHILIVLPFSYAIIRVAVIELDRAAIESATDLGARAPGLAFGIVIPMLKPGLILSAVFAFAVSFNEPLVPTFLLTTEQPVFAKLAYEGMRSGIDPLAFAASSVMVVLIVFALLLRLPADRTKAPGRVA